MNRPTLALACGTSIVGAVLLAGATRIDPGIGYDRVGPRAFPMAVGAGLVLVAVLLTVSARGAATGRPPAAAAAVQRPIDLRALVLVAAGMLLFVALVEWAGFVVAAAVQFWLVARAFDNRRPRRDAVVAIALSITVFLLFSRGLGLTLPAGPWGF